MLILGLDPGSLHTGYGLLEKRGSGLKAVAQGRFSAPSDAPLPLRLVRLSEDLDELLSRWRPETAVLESPFHGLNPRSLIVLAEARGVILARLAAHDIPISEYTPAEVKSAVTGNGRADKGQVARMVHVLLSLPGESLPTDTTDALAVAICYAQRYKMDRLRTRSL